MMKWTRYLLLMPVLMVQALSSCSLIDEPENTETGNVDVSLAFTVSSATGSSTRMADAVVQEQEHVRSYRGLGNVYMIPFAISGTQVTTSDHPSRLIDDATQIPYLKTKGDFGGFYFYNAYTMVRGINAFLVYGRASTDNITPPSGVSNKAYFGSLQVPALVTPNLGTLRFRPEPICSETEPHAEAQLLAGYLTYIAEAAGNSVSWSNTTDPTLKGYFLNFTGQENEGNLVMAGSTVNVIAHVNALYSNIVALVSDADGLINDILDRIQNPTQDIGLTLISTGENEAWKLTGIKKIVNEEPVEFVYPASEGLPDGAAALQWAEIEKNSVKKYEFVPQTQTTTTASINTITRYCYPPELFYYVNSRIDTSNKEDDMASYYGGDETVWDDVISQYEYKNAMVTGNTRAVAIQKPLQYAVGRLKMSMQAETETGKLKDAADKDVTLSETSFPLTGVIICNQHPVGFDFKPVLDEGDVASHAEDCFIYDTQIGTNYLTTTPTPIPSTLVLQSYDTGEGVSKTDAEEVTIALEFRNDSGQKFKGKDGVIYEGTKFYLMGKIDPTKGTTSNVNALGRVFTQDYITSITTTVNSLANAYNVLPDLLGGRLELGVKLTTNWIQAETTNVILDY